jgi:hypothetical protein
MGLLLLLRMRCVTELLLVRLMRIVTIVGPFEQVREEEYSHTPFSKILLVPEVRGMFTLV